MQLYNQPPATQLLSTTNQLQIMSRQFPQWWHHPALKLQFTSRRRHLPTATRGRHRPITTQWTSITWKPFHIPREVQGCLGDYQSTMSPPEGQRIKLVNKISYNSPKYFLYKFYILIFQCTVLPEESRKNYLEAEGKFSHFVHRRHKGCEHIYKPRP